MSLPKPLLGLIVHYEYLWAEPAARGQEHADKARPAAVVMAVEDEANAEIRAYVLPITHTRPTLTSVAMPIPAAVAKAAGQTSDALRLATFPKTNSRNLHRNHFTPSLCIGHTKLRRALSQKSDHSIAVLCKFETSTTSLRRTNNFQALESIARDPNILAQLRTDLEMSLSLWGDPRCNGRYLLFSKTRSRERSHRCKRDEQIRRSHSPLRKISAALSSRLRATAQNWRELSIQKPMPHRNKIHDYPYPATTYLCRLGNPFPASSDSTQHHLESNYTVDGRSRRRLSIVLRTRHCTGTMITNTFDLAATLACIRETQPAKLDELLFEAIKDKNVPAVTALITAGANVNAERPVRYGPRRQPETELQRTLAERSNLKRPLCAAINLAKRDGLDICRLLIEAGAQLNYHQDDGTTPLCKAIGSENYDLVTFLINVGADLSFQDRQGNKPHRHAQTDAMKDFLLTAIANPKHPQHVALFKVREALGLKNEFS